MPFYGATKDPTYVYSASRKAEDNLKMLAARKAYYERGATTPPEPPDKSARTRTPHWRTTEGWPEPPYVPATDRHLDEDGFQKYFGWEVAHSHLPEVQARLADPEPVFVGLKEKDANPDGFATYLDWAMRFPAIARDQFRRGYPRPHEIAADKGGKRYPPYANEGASAKARTPKKHKRAKRTKQTTGGREPVKKTDPAEPNPLPDSTPPEEDPNASCMDGDDLSDGDDFSHFH